MPLKNTVKNTVKKLDGKLKDERYQQYFIFELIETHMKNRGYMGMERGEGKNNLIF